MEDMEKEFEEKDGQTGEDKKGQLKGDSKKQNGMDMYDWLQCFITAIVAGIIIFIFVARVVKVDGSSMYGTLHNDDLVLASNLFYEPEAGDIVVLQTDSYGPSALVKRIIATEGQRVYIDFNAGIVYVDGVPLDEPYTNTLTNLPEDFSGEVTVPEGCVFLLGDNRNASRDSRDSSIGMVDERCIVGKVYFILIPGEDYTDYGISLGRDFSRIGSPY